MRLQFVSVYIKQYPFIKSLPNAAMKDSQEKAEKKDKATTTHKQIRMPSNPFRSFSVFVFQIAIYRY